MVRHGSRTPCAGTCWRWRRNKSGQRQSSCQTNSGNRSLAGRDEARTAVGESDGSGEEAGGNFLERLFVRFQRFFGVQPSLGRKKGKRGHQETTKSREAAVSGGGRSVHTVPENAGDRQGGDAYAAELGEGPEEDELEEEEEADRDDDVEEDEDWETADGENSRRRSRPPSILQAAWSLPRVSLYAKSLVSGESPLPPDSRSFLPFFFSPFLRASAFFSAAFSKLALPSSSSSSTALPSSDCDERQFPEDIAASAGQPGAAATASVGARRSFPADDATADTGGESSSVSSSRERGVHDDGRVKTMKENARRAEDEKLSKKGKRKPRPWNCLFQEGGFFLSKSTYGYYRLLPASARRATPS